MKTCSPIPVSAPHWRDCECVCVLGRGYVCSVGRKERGRGCGEGRKRGAERVGREGREGQSVWGGKEERVGACCAG